MSASENLPPRPLDQSVIDAQDETGDLPFEIRVHGIGNHDDLSAMGAPHEFIAPTRDQAAVVSAPIVPRHRLRLVNWSHISRITAKFLWFLALPFTLINAAGNMGRPSPGGPSRLRRILFGLPIVCTGLLLSALMIVWTIAIGETILNRWKVDQSEADVAAIGLVCAAVAIALGVVWYRNRSNESRPSGLLSLAHVAVILAVGWSVIVYRPANLEAQPFAVNAARASAARIGVLPASLERDLRVLADRVFQVSRPASVSDREKVKSLTYPDGTTPQYGEQLCIATARPDIAMRREWDVMNIAVLGSLAFVGLLALPLVAMSAITFFRGRDGATYAGAALALVGAVTVLHAFMGSVRLGTEWLTSYLDGFAALTLVEPTSRLADSDRMLLSIQWIGSCQLGGEVIGSPAVFGLIVAVAFAITFCLANAIGREGARWPRAVFDRTEWLKYSHRLVGSLGTSRILVATLVAFLVLPLAVFLWLIYVAGYESLLSDYLLQFSTAADAVPFNRVWPISPAVYWVSLVAENVDRLVAQLVAGITIAYLLSNGRVPYLAEAISKIADIIGFWPLEWHPFAARSYRSTLLAGIDAAIAHEAPRPVVLVGHSQGSVVAAWYVEQCRKNPARAVPIRYLVTCGSPLVSLYQRFFPRYFGDDFFATLKGAGWLNLWRDTDPIATTLPATRDEPLTDPSPSDGKARGHSDYWTDRVQVAAVRSLVRSGDVAALDAAIEHARHGAPSNHSEPGTPKRAVA